MAASSLKGWRAASLGLAALAVVVACSSSDFSANGGSAGRASGDAGDAGDDGDAGRASAGRAGGRAGSGGTSASAGKGSGGRAEEAGEGGTLGEAGAVDHGGSGGIGGSLAGTAGVLLTGGGGSVGVAGGGQSGGAPSAGSGSGGAGTCTTPVAYYADDDEDTFGRTTAKVMACQAPAGKWALKGDDCNDDNKLVFPKQPTYRATGYVVSGGTSFDYDCNNQEDPDPTQVGLAPNCPSFLFTNCAGSGFKSTERTGSGVNPVCGSTTIVTCTVDGLGCKNVESPVTQGARCR